MVSLIEQLVASDDDGEFLDDRDIIELQMIANNNLQKQLEQFPRACSPAGIAGHDQGKGLALIELTLSISEKLVLPFGALNMVHNLICLFDNLVVQAEGANISNQKL